MKILVAGIGNLFLGDDGFGCEVVRRLSESDLPEGVDVVDFGIRGMDLGYALMEGYDLAVLIDTVDRNAAPGTLFVIEPEVDANSPETSESEASSLSPHGMDPVRVLQFVDSFGTPRPRLLLIGCQPEYLGGEEGLIGLSEAVEASIDSALMEVWKVLDEHLPKAHNEVLSLSQVN